MTVAEMETRTKHISPRFEWSLMTDERKKELAVTKKPRKARERKNQQEAIAKNRKDIEKQKIHQTKLDKLRANGILEEYCSYNVPQNSNKPWIEEPTSDKERKWNPTKQATRSIHFRYCAAATMNALAYACPEQAWCLARNWCTKHYETTKDQIARMILKTPILEYESDAAICYLFQLLRSHIEAYRLQWLTIITSKKSKFFWKYGFNKWNEAVVPIDLNAFDAQSAWFGYKDTDD